VVDLPRHEVWRRRYRARRYLGHLTKPELDARFGDILSNITTLTLQNQVGLLGLGPEGKRWLVLWTECLEEFQLRYGPYPNGLPKEGTFVDAVPRPSERGRSAGRLANAPVPEGQYLVRYSDPRFIREAHERGRIRFGVASAYSDPSLNYAIRDDELLLELAPEPGTYDASALDLEGRGLAQHVGVRFRHRAPTDFLVLCLSRRLLPRLFSDFSADACLLIRDPGLFLRTLRESLDAASHPLDLLVGPVCYVDPVRPKNFRFDMRFSKHFRYSYQEEYRVVLQPRDPGSPIEPLFVELGPMTGYAEMRGPEV